jgi:hypothetical protein
MEQVLREGLRFRRYPLAGNSTHHNGAPNRTLMHHYGAKGLCGGAFLVYGRDKSLVFLQGKELNASFMTHWMMHFCYSIQ